MSMTIDQVQKVARLARISIPEEHLNDYSEKLSGLMDIIDALQTVDTDGVEPMAHPYHLEQRLREDEVTEVNQVERFQSQAPQVEDGLYLVPQVIE